MSNSNNNTQVDVIEQAIQNQKLIQENKDWKKSEISKAKKELNDELTLIQNACDNTTKDMTDAIQIAQVSLAFQAKKLEKRAELQPNIDALRVQLETITAGAGAVAGDKLGATIAPVTKGLSSFWGSLKARA